MQDEASDNFNIVEYEPGNVSQIIQLKVLLNSRNMDLGLLYDLPKLGYLALNGNTVVAAGFLRHSESNTVMLDGLISNKNVPSFVRNYVLDVLVKNLIKLAQVNGYKQIMAFSSDKNTLERALSHGFELLPHSVIGLRLPGD